MVSDLTILIPVPAKVDIADHDGFLKRLLESCPALAAFEARDLPKRVRDEQFSDGLDLIRQAGGDPVTMHRAMQQYKMDFKSVAKGPEPTSEEERAAMRASVWRWDVRNDGPGCSAYPTLTGPYDVRLNFRNHMLEAVCFPKLDSALPEFYPRHLELGRQLTRMVEADRALYLPASMCAEFGMEVRLEEDFEKFLDWATNNALPRWQRLDEIRRDKYDFQGHYFEPMSSG